MGDKLTLTERIYHELYHDITSQKLCCGQKLTLTELKKTFQRQSDTDTGGSYPSD